MTPNFRSFIQHAQINVSMAAIVVAIGAAMAPVAEASVGYELVSPGGDGAYDVGDEPGIAPQSPNTRRTKSDGSAAVFSLSINGTLPGMAVDGDALDYVVASRTADGWVSDAPTADRTECPPIHAPHFDHLSADGEKLLLRIECDRDREVLGGVEPGTGALLDQVFSTPVTIQGPGDGSLYTGGVFDSATTFVSGRFGASGPIPRTDDNRSEFLGASPDLATVYFTTGGGLLPGVPDVVGQAYLYKKVGDDPPILLTLDGSGEPFAHSWVNLTPNPLYRPNAVSTDGGALTLASPFPMTATAPTVAEIYQVRDEQVVWMSDPDAVRPDNRPPSQDSVDKAFEGASADGRRVVFSTVQQMTADDIDGARDLYAYDAAAPADDRISRVSRLDEGPCASCDDNASNGDPLASSTAKFSTVSRDGSHVFFVTGDVLDDADADGQPSLYVRDLANPATIYVAPAAAGVSDETDGVDAGTSVAYSLTFNSEQRDYARRPIRVSENGERAVFLLGTNVDLPADRGGTDADDSRDLYLWSQPAGLRRVRQGMSAEDNTPSVPTLGCVLVGRGDGSLTTCRGITDDGAVAYFEASDTLSNEDTDNGQVDVYGVDVATGDITLVSPPGGAPVPSSYLDNSASGDSVFFLTRETIDPSRDQDRGRMDLYVARTGPVFAPIPPPTPPCAPEACQGPPAPPPGRLGSSTGTSGEPDNVVPPARVQRRLLVARPSARALKRLARDGRSSVVVTLTGGGRVTVMARGRIGRRLRGLGAGTATVRAKGKTVVRVPLELSRAARRALRANGTLVLRIHASAGDLDRATGSVTLQAPSRGNA